jgi:hypothetical protein
MASRAAVSAWDGPQAADQVIAAKDLCLGVLAAARPFMVDDDFRSLYGQVLDVEDISSLRTLYREISQQLPESPS